MDCPKCFKPVTKETDKEIDYPFVCHECDENFFSIELLN